MAANWLQPDTFHPRMIVAVEDHVYHISELLESLPFDAPELSGQITIVCLDRRGPDTDEAVAEWLAKYPDLQIAAAILRPDRFSGMDSRLMELPESFFSNQHEYCRSLAGMIRRRGILLQDIELETLGFIPRDRWWESTMLASTVRGIVGEGAPRCCFISNKRGYEATFGAELLAAGHDPRDVLNKYEVRRTVVPVLKQHAGDFFPYEIHSVEIGNDAVYCQRASDIGGDLEDIHRSLDVVIWPEKNGSLKLGGAAFSPDSKTSIELTADGNESMTWNELVAESLGSQQGVEVIRVGERVAPTGALRAEATNAAARHIHSMRKRLVESKDIVTMDGHYRFREGLRVGQVRHHSTKPA